MRASILIAAALCALAAAVDNNEQAVLEAGAAPNTAKTNAVSVMKTAYDAWKTDQLQIIAQLQKTVDNIEKPFLERIEAQGKIFAAADAAIKQLEKDVADESAKKAAAKKTLDEAVTAAKGKAATIAAAKAKYTVVAGAIDTTIEGLKKEKTAATQRRKGADETLTKLKKDSATATAKFKASLVAAKGDFDQKNKKWVETIQKLTDELKKLQA